VTPELIALIVRIKKTNPTWGGRKIRNTLKSMGILISEPLVRKILGENGFDPYGPPRTWERFRSTAKDAIWAADYFVVRTA
jgi:hypothetical protein